MTRIANVVVIAPVGVTVTVKSPCRHHTLIFSSVQEFERWRHGGGSHAQATIAPYVRKALSMVKGTPNALGPVIDWLSRRHTTPTVKELSAAWSSRRSFFRAWKCEMTVSPRELLHLIRCLHAADLLRRGMAEREVMKKIGFRTVATLHRALLEARVRRV